MTDFRAEGTIMGLAGLTAVFGMGTGVTPPVWSPGTALAGLCNPPGSVAVSWVISVGLCVAAAFCYIREQHLGRWIALCVGSCTPSEPYFACIFIHASLRRRVGVVKPLGC